MAWEAFTTAKDITHEITGVIFWHKVNEGVVIQVWESETILRRAVIICIVFEDTVYIVIATIVTPEDSVNTALDILHIGTGLQHLRVESRTYSSSSMVNPTSNSSTKVVTAIDIVLYPWETAVVTYMYLCTTIDISIAGTTESIVYTAVAQEDIRISEDIALITATVDVFGFRNGQTTFRL